MYDPKTKKFPYPSDTAEHYITVKKDNGLVFDKNYPYIDESKKMKAKRAFVRFMLGLVVFPAARIRLGLRIKGKENLEKNKEIIKNGVISCSNHVHFWDYICIMRAIRPSKPYMLVWDKNVRGESGTLVRLVGGIPIPQGDAHEIGRAHV